MNITCPHCEFSREVERSQIPPAAKTVICPRCKKRFELTGLTAPESEAVATDAVTPTSEAPTAVPPADAAVAPLSAADRPKAGFWIRVVASLLDSLLLGCVQLVFTVVLELSSGVADPQGGAALGLVTSLASLVLSISYYVFFTGYGGQTPGKMVLRIRVIRTSGAEIGYGRAFLREVPGKFLSAILFGIGYLMVAFDERKQGLHDRIADTFVIKL